ncbi:hypothetical protein K2Z84_05240 [Candidatus Binatia bacterium]|nr:hypothetical protein [Candidatus Binatia bacterium]
MTLVELIAANLASNYHHVITAGTDELVDNVAQTIAEEAKRFARALQRHLFPVATVVVAVKYPDGQTIRHLLCDRCWLARSERPTWATVVGYEGHERGLTDTNGAPILCQECR